MYVCICNAITDREIDQAIADGHGSVDAIYRACGVAPQCGTCADQIRTMIDLRLTASAGPSADPVLATA